MLSLKSRASFLFCSHIAALRLKQCPIWLRWIHSDPLWISQGDTDSTKHPLDYHNVPIQIAILGASPDFKQTRLIDCYLSSQAQACGSLQSHPLPYECRRWCFFSHDPVV